MIRPDLKSITNKEQFLQYYYLKEELIAFCKENNLSSSGSKEVLTNRIASFLNGSNLLETKQATKKNLVTIITLDTSIEENIVCSEVHRRFFKEQIGKQFTFNVVFQNWLKVNSGNPYSEAILAWYKIKEERTNKQTIIGKQFEYNAYIRDFFAVNKDLSLPQAIMCWNYKKNLAGPHNYEESDLIILK